MKRGDFLGLSWTALFGIIFAVIFILFAWNGTSFADVLFHLGDDKKVEESMDFLQNKIYDLNIGETKDVAFYSSGDNVYLMSFNKDYRNPLECYDSACIVLCSDENCASAFYVRKLPDSIEFENPGKIMYLGDAEETTFNLVIENVNGKIKVGIAGIDCNTISDCTSYGSNVVACTNNPCGIDGTGWGCEVSGSDVCINSPALMETY
jgi:hypothetical protein